MLLNETVIIIILVHLRNTRFKNYKLFVVVVYYFVLACFYLICLRRFLSPNANKDRKIFV